MKIFNSDNSGWDSKVNFVDENNVLLGYDTAQDCCEHADWFISSEIKGYSYTMFDEQLNQTTEGWEGWVFDKEFRHIQTGGDLDSGEMVSFKITKGDEVAFINIFNAHNGYYSHGFTFSDDGTEIESRSI